MCKTRYLLERDAACSRPCLLPQRSISIIYWIPSRCVGFVVTPESDQPGYPVADMPHSRICCNSLKRQPGRLAREADEPFEARILPQALPPPRVVFRDRSSLLRIGREVGREQVQGLVPVPHQVPRDGFDIDQVP